MIVPLSSYSRLPWKTCVHNELTDKLLPMLTGEQKIDIKNKMREKEEEFCIR
jgi:hypothetical protein